MGVFEIIEYIGLGIVGVIFIGLIFFLSINLFDGFNNSIQSSDAIDADTKTFFDEQNTRYSSTLDWMFTGFFAILAIAILLTARFYGVTGAAPLLLFIGLFLFTYIAAAVSNNYQVMTAAGAVDVQTLMPISSLIMNNLVIWLFGVGALAMYFGRSGREEL